MDQDEDVKKLTNLRDSLRLLLQVEGKEVHSFTTHNRLCFHLQHSPIRIYNLDKAIDCIDILVTV